MKYGPFPEAARGETDEFPDANSRAIDNHDNVTHAHGWYSHPDEYLRDNPAHKVIEISSGQREQNPTFIGDKKKVMVELNE